MGINNVKQSICIFNADGSFNPKELNSMYKKLENNNYDLVFASDMKRIVKVTMIQLLLILVILFLH